MVNNGKSQSQRADLWISDLKRIADKNVARAV